MGVKEYDEILDFQFGLFIYMYIYKLFISQVNNYTYGPIW